MPELTIEQLVIAVGIAGGLAVLALLWSVVLAFKLRKVRKMTSAGALDGSSGGGDMVALSTPSGRMERRVDELKRALDEQSAVSRFALQRFAVIRYDAFEDMGGRLSFSAAVLDDHGDGIILTSINGRSETRTYAKPVENMSSSHNLSDEEREAIAAAVAGQHRSENREIASPSA
ncbi:MAG: DUF4446 family protein [Actinomycetota bacterium]